MTTLYTNGNFIRLNPAEFNSYSVIRYSASQLSSSVYLGLSSSGTVSFAGKLGMISAEVDGWTGNDAITADGGNDTIWGNSGNDTLSGAAGNDTLIGDWDTVDRVGNDILYGGDGDDELNGGYGSDNLQGGNGDDVFSYGEHVAGNDTLFGGAGIDTVSVRDVFGTGLTNVSFNRLVLTAAASVEFFALDDSNMALLGTVGNNLVDLSGTIALTWTGTAYEKRVKFELGKGNDSFIGGTSAESVILDGAADFISLGEGNDHLILVGSSLVGSTITGGLGYDTLELRDSAANKSMTANVLTLTAAAGFEALLLQNISLHGTVAADRFDLSGIRYLQGLGAPIAMGEGNDFFSGSSSDDVVDGMQGNDTLYGGQGSDWMLGGAGADLLKGGQGDDVYHVDSLSDVTIELADEGIDRIQTSLVTYTLGATFEYLVVTGNHNFFGTGNAVNNQISGGGGKDHLVGLGGFDTLDGGGGIDTLEGGSGNDIYHVTTGDVIIEGPRADVDVVYAQTALYTMGANLEVMYGVAQVAFNGTGNQQTNTIYGTNYIDTLSGMAGDDSLFGGLGGDELFGGLGKDSIYGEAGTDRLTGGGDADQLFGGDGNDFLDGSAGDDALYGGLGDDRYAIREQNDTIVDASGINSVVSFLNEFHLPSSIYSIEADASLSGVKFYGSALGNVLRGSSGNDQLYGEGGDDILYSSPGSDTLYGGVGSDTYYFAANTEATLVVETSAFVDRDKIYSAAALTILTSFVEELHITSTTGATGRAESTTYSWLYGGIGNDRLEFGSLMDGGLGADTMVGSAAGGAIFVVDDPGDVVQLAAGGASETVYLKTAAYVMDPLLENLMVLGTANALVTGSDFANGISGGKGRDTLNGMGGDDALGGLGGRDLLRGGEGNDTLYMDGNDTLVGGLGDDVYKDIYEGAVIVEWVDGGYDRLDLQIYVTTFTLPTNVEELHFTAYLGACVGTGNNQANLISAPSAKLTAYGLGGNDTLEGSYNRSTLYGGLGDDQYILRGGDAGTFHEVVEGIDEGIDTVFTTGKYDLPDNVERLTIMDGFAGLAGGNELDNVLIGNSGNDWLIARSGNDTLTGGAGNDLFRFEELGWVDHVTDFESGNRDSLMILSSMLPGLTTELNTHYIAQEQFKDLSTAAADGSDRILYDPNTGNLFYDADGAGGVDAILFVVIENRGHLSYSDFWLL